MLLRQYLPFQLQEHHNGAQECPHVVILSRPYEYLKRFKIKTIVQVSAQLQVNDTNPIDYAFINHEQFRKRKRRRRDVLED